MRAFRLSPHANRQLDEIYDYSCDTWGEAQADSYIHGLFDEFAAIMRRETPWRPLPARLELTGFYRSWRRHVIYWKVDDDGRIAIIAILHERMAQDARLTEAWQGDTAPD